MASSESASRSLACQSVQVVSFAASSPKRNPIDVHSFGHGVNDQPAPVRAALLEQVTKRRIGAHGVRTAIGWSPS